jgi:hypothetical protein
LNSLAWAFGLLVRDLMNGDMVGWIDDQLQSAQGASKPELEAARQEALIPLRNVYGISDKILTMTLSTLLIGARNIRPVWFETGKAMLAIDTLVHNWLIRTGILFGKRQHSIVQRLLRGVQSVLRLKSRKAASRLQLRSCCCSVSRPIPKRSWMRESR